MSKVTQPSDLGQITEQKDFNNKCSNVISELVDAVNGNLDFLTNVNCCFASGTIAANTRLALKHTLGRVPSGKIVIYQTSHDAIYDATVGNTTDTIYLWCDSAGDFKLILF